MNRFMYGWIRELLTSASKLAKIIIISPQSPINNYWRHSFLPVKEYILTFIELNDIV